MARRRLQQRGDLYQQGGWWKLRWREDQLLADGSVKRRWSRPVIIGPAPGNPSMQPLTEKQARRVAWEQFLSRLDQHVSTPRSIVTLREFVRERFEPEHIAALRPSGQAHYRFMLAHAMGFIGDMRLRDITAADVQRVVSGLLTRGLSTQTARHVRNCLSAVFKHAEAIGWHPGPNPARLVRLPELVRRPAHALTFEQARALLAALSSPEREMVTVLLLTSLNVAELCGLQWKHVNLSDQMVLVDGEPLPPLHLAVRQQYYRGRYGGLKKRARKRDVPLCSLLVQVFSEIRARSKWTGLCDPVFVARNGSPVDEHNVMRRKIKPVAAALGMPWVSWHVFRRSTATLAAQIGVSLADRAGLLGHADVRMAAWYTLPDQERRRAALEAIANRLTGVDDEFSGIQ